MVVEEVMRQWVYLVTGGTGGQEGWGMVVLYCTDLLYAKIVLVTTNDPDWLQGACDTLIGLSDRLGIWKSFGKTVEMLYHHCHVVGTQL